MIGKALLTITLVFYCSKSLLMAKPTQLPETSPKPLVQKMLPKFQYNNQEIIQLLQNSYELKIDHLSRLSLGADFNTTVYQGITHNKEKYFIKIRSGDFYGASVSIPNYLSHIGFKNIIAPLSTKSEKCWAQLHNSKVILYPYVDGRNAIDSKLSETLWQELGTIIKKLHTTHIPKTICNDIPKETFASKWHNTITSFIKNIQNKKFNDPICTQAASFLKSKNEIIVNLIEQVEKLRALLQAQSFDYVLCHADIHGWNLLIDEKNTLYLIDWDTLILAPKERDLMFIGAGIWNSGNTYQVEETLFYKGYGKAEINKDAIAYYRLDRIIQDIDEYCEHIFLSHESHDSRMQSFEYLQSNFLPNGTIERACASSTL